MSSLLRLARPFVSPRYMIAPAPARPYVPPTQGLDYNAAVLSYARAAMGQQIGDGECWALVNAALGFAGARQPGTNGLGIYEFGRLVLSSSGTPAYAYARPGDIIRFEGLALEYPGGTGSYSFPKHTAIIELVQGSQVTVIEQNSNGRRFVTRATYDLNWVTAGQYWIYRPQAR